MRLYTPCPGYADSRRDSSWLVETHAMRLLLFAQPENIDRYLPCRDRRDACHASLHPVCRLCR